MVERKYAKEELATFRKMIYARSAVLERYPFYGNLVMHLQLGVMDCGTACTDMKHVWFDPAFAERLSDEEMIFVMLHELLHCALLHCTRGQGRDHWLFNIATDIVVNSNILYSMNLPEFRIDGEKAMHTMPDGQEGYLFSAEEVYDMLLSNIQAKEDQMPAWASDQNDCMEDDTGTGTSAGQIDSHDVWETVEENDALSDQWKTWIVEARKSASKDDIPPAVREYMVEQ